jgi:EAL and modified HD-GYP domain-containing signal transduction protein
MNYFPAPLTAEVCVPRSPDPQRKRLKKTAIVADDQDVSASPAKEAVPSSAIEGFRFVARQPILNRDQQVIGYELLFRDGIENFFRSQDADAAARSTLDSTLLMGFDVLCNGQKAFINCTRELLLKDGITLLPSGQTVVEVLENVEPDDLVIAACERLRAAGYTIALDDYVARDPREPLIPLADILKVDFERTTVAEQAALAKRYQSPRCMMLAEKVETREQFVAAREIGYVYFQGYFFRRPEVLKAKEIPANRINYLRMLEAISRQELDVRELENLIKSEASVLYRLLRYLNSPMFAFENEIHSVRHALAILGERETRRWIRLVTLVSAAMQRSTDLVLSALVRARFCELLAEKVPRRTGDPFLLGMMSMMDAILEIPMSEVLEKIPLDQETKTVLLGGDGPVCPIYQLMLAQEAGDWQRARALAVQLRMSESEAGELWWQALQWARQVGDLRSRRR